MMMFAILFGCLREKWIPRRAAGTQRGEEVDGVPDVLAQHREWAQHHRHVASASRAVLAHIEFDLSRCSREAKCLVYAEIRPMRFPEFAAKSGDFGLGCHDHP